MNGRMPRHTMAEWMTTCVHCSVLGEGGDDVRIAGVGDGKGADAEQLAACGAEGYIVTLEVFNKSLGEESIVLDLALAAAVVRQISWKKKSSSSHKQQTQTYRSGGVLLARRMSFVLPVRSALRVDL